MAITQGRAERLGRQSKKACVPDIFDVFGLQYATAKKHEVRGFQSQEIWRFR